MSTPNPENSYLQQVLEEQEEVARQLRKVAPPAMASTPGGFVLGNMIPDVMPNNHTTGRSIDYRITGFWIWRSVVVPPNVYVIHTRRGQNDPIHIGRGISFRFNPLTDAFLIIPSSVQTVLINAKCISREKQGLLVQAYVQWIIDDIKIAYWKLDFSDPTDPMGIVNLQLKEQAEAAIKDKVATLTIDEVLSDKQPIIEELTNRLQTVAEGNRQDGNNSGGLGLKIVTVQIKEAVVSSTQLWQNLQAPFRAERQKVARLAELENQQIIHQRELENRIVSEQAEINANNELEELRAEKERLQAERQKTTRIVALENQQLITQREVESRLNAEQIQINASSQLEELKAEKEQILFNRNQAEDLRRHTLEQEGNRRKLLEENETLKARNEANLALILQELELEKQRILAEKEKVQQQIELDEIQNRKTKSEVIAELELQTLRQDNQNMQKQRELALLQQEREIENNLSQSYLQRRLIEQLPEIAKQLPTPDEQRTIIISGDGKESNGMSTLLGWLVSAIAVTKDAWKGNTSQEN